MKESISYTFLLNIIITFVFLCFAIIMGIFSYYRAFKANNIIINEIEKYEGYNCLSKESIGRKLSGISYNVPFEATCSAFKGESCAFDDDKNYAIISYNLDYNSWFYINGDGMNTQYNCTGYTSCYQTLKYQYGVYTYMYIDLPVVSNLIKLRLFGKTSIMTEFRNVVTDTKKNIYDENNIPDVYKNMPHYGNIAPKDYLVPDVTKNYAKASVDNPDAIGPTSDGISSRLLYQYDANYDGKFDGSDSSFIGGGYGFECGTIRDYSRY